MKDSIELSGMAADGLSLLGIDVYRVNPPETMAWIWFIAKGTEDDEKTFPTGKWATLQHIEAQLQQCVRERKKE